MKIYACTTIGGTRYIKEWFEAIKKLNPYKITIARDISRSEQLPDDLHVYVINHDSGLKWKSYEERHLNWESDVSILKGIIVLIEDMLKTEATHFLHIDSDTILSNEAIETINLRLWDYLQIRSPAIPRGLIKEKQSEWRKHVMLFSDGTNFGISRGIASQILNDLRNLLPNPYPVDINIHRLIRTLKPVKCMSLTHGITHYMRGEKFFI